MPLEYRVDRSRLSILSAFYFLLSAVLLVRLFILQIIQHSLYEQKADLNLKASLYEPAFRGQIYDRDGRLLSSNNRHFDLYIEGATEKVIDEILAALTPIWGVQLKEQVWRRARNQPLFEPLLVKRELSLDELAGLGPWLFAYPDLQIKERFLRSYPYGPSCAHLIGYTQPEKLYRHHRPDISAERPITGLEARCDHQLRGQPSKFIVSKNAQNHRIDKERLSTAESGQSLKLTINALWQQEAYELLNSAGVCGSIVILDVQTGSILVAASSPSFDPEKIRYEPELYHDDLQRPLFCRALQGLYPPASLIKPFVAIAALEEGIINAETEIDDPGYYQPSGSKQRFHDWKKKGHGKVHVEKAIAESCDTFFYILGDTLGIEVLHDWLKSFGFGQSFEHLPLTTTSGLLPSKSWKSQRLKTPWYRGDSIQTAIGQGYLSATPLQLAYATALIASKGRTPLPQILQDQEPIWPEFISRLQDVSCWELIQHSMEQVVDAPQGTAHHKIAALGLDIAGKTGTAQVISHNTKHHGEKKYHDHSLFMAYAPRRNPEIACVVIIENHTGATTIAGQLLKKISKDLFKQKKDSESLGGARNQQPQSPALQPSSLNL